RRHTRWPRDWSSDVCSSDLPGPSYYATNSESKRLQSDSCSDDRCSKGKAMETAALMEKWKNELHVFPLSHKRLENSSQKPRDERSEERRVGKECRGGGRRDN